MPIVIGGNEYVLPPNFEQLQWSVNVTVASYSMHEYTWSWL